MVKKYHSDITTHCEPTVVSDHSMNDEVTKRFTINNSIHNLVLAFIGSFTTIHDYPGFLELRD